MLSRQKFIVSYSDAFTAKDKPHLAQVGGFFEVFKFLKRNA